MQVAELVQAVTVRRSFAVGALDQLVAGERLEQLQMRGVGLVPAGQQAVDGANPRLGRDDEVRPPLAGADRPVGRGGRLERADDGRADGDHLAAPPSHGVHDAGGRCGDAVALGEWWLAELG